MAIVKDLGMVTAYAYAVAGGYEGTEAEFTELLGQAGVTLEQLENLSAVAVTLAPGSEATASYSDGVLTFGIPKGEKGDKGDKGDKGNKGDTGNGIASIAKTGTSGLADTYTITFTDGTTTTFTVTNGADGNITNIAAAFDSTKAYSVGDMVLYQGTLYAFTATHSAGDWTGSDAQAVILADVVSGLDKTYTSTLSFTLVNDEYVDANSGEFKQYGGWSRTDYIDLDGVSDFTSNKSSSYSGFYNADHVHVGKVIITANQPVTVPENAVYLVVSGATTDMNNLSLSCTRSGALKSAQDQINNLNELVNENIYVYPTAITENAYVDQDGNITTGASGYIASDYISLPFNQVQKFYLRSLVYGNASCCIYDANHNPLLIIKESNVSQYGGTATGSYSVLTIPYIEGMRYARVSSRTAIYTAITDLWAYGNSIAGAFEQIAELDKDIATIKANVSNTISQSKVLVIGDSISADAYGNYPKWVTDLINEGFLPADTNNSSQHATGFVARYDSQPNDFITRLKAIEDPSQYDLVIVFGGINDYIQNIHMGSETGTDYTVSFKPAVNEFFSYLMSNFTQARLCVLLPLRNYQNWDNSVGERQEAYAEYIKTVAKKYCLPVLNLTEESGFCPYISDFSDMWTLIPQGYSAGDGTHPNELYESKYLAPMIKHFLQGLM